jgi:hypothetical protein
MYVCAHTHTHTRICIYTSSTREESEVGSLTAKVSELEILKRQAAADRAEVDVLRGKLADVQVCMHICLCTFICEGSEWLNR